MRSDEIKLGIKRAGQRSLLRATGVRDGDFQKPFIAIVNSHVDIIPGHVHLQTVGNFVKECVKEAGGVPFIFNTIGVDDGIAMGSEGMKYSLPSRELIADSVEIMINAHYFDAMICITNCDKIVPGMLMAAMRCNIPTIFTSGGPMEAGRDADGKSIDLVDVFTGATATQQNRMDPKKLEELERSACPTCGSCSGMFTANSMNCLCEALGMALPGNGTILATSEERKKIYQKAARRIVEMAREYAEQGDQYGFLPRKIASLEAFDNAMALDMAMGGSTNTVLHVLAIAAEAGVPYSMEKMDALSRKTPTLCKLSPSRPDFHIEDCHLSGGIHTILGELARGVPGLLNLDRPTVTGKTLGENIADHDIRGEKVTREALEMAAVLPGGKQSSQAWTVKKSVNSIRDLSKEELGFDPYDCIRTVENAYSKEGGIAILKGTLAPHGAVVKTAGVDPKMLQHRGPARIFNSEKEAYEGICTGKVQPGDVVVVRYEGPRGGPGMQEMLAVTAGIVSANLADKCSLVTDGRFSGGTAGGCIGHVSPEAANRGPIGLIREGEIIEIDIPARRLDVQLSPEEIKKRQDAYTPPSPRYTTGYLAKYASMATSADTGGILEFKIRQEK